jgi:hypothetical protein
MKVVIGSKYYFLDMGDIDLRDPTTVEDCAGSLRVRAFVPEVRYGKMWHGQASIDRSDVEQDTLTGQGQFEVTTEDAEALALGALTVDRCVSSHELFTTADECYSHWNYTLERRIDCLHRMQETMEHWENEACDPCEPEFEME